MFPYGDNREAIELKMKTAQPLWVTPAPECIKKK